MYRIKKTLSAKTNAEGKKQIHIQINVSRTCRPRLKTNVHVLPDCFDEKKGEIVIPKRGKLNVAKLKMQLKQQRSLIHIATLQKESFLPLMVTSKFQANG